VSDLFFVTAPPALRFFVEYSLARLPPIRPIRPISVAYQSSLVFGINRYRFKLAFLALWV
jgi:hypothetical protein